MFVCVCFFPFRLGQLEVYKLIDPDSCDNRVIFCTIHLLTLSLLFPLLITMPNSRSLCQKLQDISTASSFARKVLGPNDDDVVAGVVVVNF